MADTHSFTTTPERLKNLSSMLAEHGVHEDFSAQSGEVNESGWHLTWNKPAPTQFDVTVLKHPFGAESIMLHKLSEVLS